MPIAFPYHVTADGRTATTDLDAHVAQMIRQVLFTSPGERVNRPTFGTGAQQLVFAGADDELATSTEGLIQSALLEWMGDVIRAEDVTVVVEEATLKVSVRYVVLRNQERREQTFERRLSAL